MISASFLGVGGLIYCGWVRGCGLDLVLRVELAFACLLCLRGDVVRCGLSISAFLWMVVGGLVLCVVWLLVLASSFCGVLCICLCRWVSCGLV